MKLLYFIGLALGFAAFGFGVGYDFRALQLAHFSQAPPNTPPAVTQAAGQVPSVHPLPSPQEGPLTLKEITIRDLKKQIQTEQVIVKDLSNQLNDIEAPINVPKMDDFSNRITDQARVLGDIAAEIELQNQQAFLNASQENFWVEDQKRHQELSLSQLQDQIKAAQSRVGELATTVRQLQANNINYADLPALTIQLQEAESQLASLQDKLAANRSQAGIAGDQKETYNQQQLENLRITEQQLQSRYQQELAKYENLQGDYQKLLDQQQERSQNAEDLNDKLETEKHKLADLQRKLETLTSS